MGKTIEVPTAAERERLLLIIEECSEAIKLCTKIMRFGYDSTHPAREHNNRKRLAHELGHIGAAVSFLVDAGDISRLEMIGAQVEKQQTIGPHTHFQNRM